MNDSDMAVALEVDEPAQRSIPAVEPEVIETVMGRRPSVPAVVFRHEEETRDLVRLSSRIRSFRERGWVIVKVDSQYDGRNALVVHIPCESIERANDVYLGLLEEIERATSDLHLTHLSAGLL